MGKQLEEYPKGGVVLLSVNQLYGNRLRAFDGDIGQVRDCYFDDPHWAVRYLVADTSSWLPGRHVLISPHSLSRLDPVGKVLRVNLTRKEIENSPSIESHKPVSRQYEEEYHRYYGWPFYWEGDGLWGMSGLPALDRPPLASEPATASGQQAKHSDADLRSTQAAGACHRQASDEGISHVCDFLIDAQSWAICQLVLKTGPRFSCKGVAIPTRKVEKISWEESTMFIGLARGAVGQRSAHNLKMVGAEV